jgi:hypothetical protein
MLRELHADRLFLAVDGLDVENGPFHSRRVRSSAQRHDDAIIYWEEIIESQCLYGASVNKSHYPSGTGEHSARAALEDRIMAGFVNLACARKLAGLCPI